jgi:hypothetical protein
MEAEAANTFTDTQTQARYSKLSEKCGDLNDYINKVVSELQAESGVNVSIIRGSKTGSHSFSASLIIDAAVFNNK